MIENRRAEKISRAGRCTVLPAVTHQLRLLFNPGLDIGNGPLLVRLADDRTQKHTILFAVPDLQPVSSLSQPAHQFISNALMHHHDGASHAALARRTEGSSNNILHRIIEIGIRKHN
ncbi:hypothetical protein D3C73_1094600 [compost metagenome]